MSGVPADEISEVTSWVAGQGPPPWWAEVLVMAREWATPPWRILEEAPAEWVERFAVYQRAQRDAADLASGHARLIDGRVYRRLRA